MEKQHHRLSDAYLAAGCSSTAAIPSQLMSWSWIKGCMHSLPTSVGCLGEQGQRDIGAEARGR